MCDVFVGTGEVVHAATDIDLRGYPGFAFRRSYSSTRSETGTLGPGWRHTWDVSLKFEADRYVVRDGLSDPISVLRRIAME